MAKQVSLMSKFDKELFKKNVIDNVKTLYRKTLDEANPQQIFQAVSYAIKDLIVGLLYLYELQLLLVLHRQLPVLHFLFLQVLF